MRIGQAHSANAKVAAKDIVEDARAASRRDPCEVLQRISKIKSNSADTPLYQVFHESGLTLGIEISTATVGDLENYPYVDPRDFLEQLSDLGYFHKVIGLPKDLAEVGLTKFWDNFRRIFPNHPVFDQYLEMHRVIPYYLHGDGGRGFKKDPIEILSMFPALGTGTRLRPVELVGHKRRRDEALEMGVNLTGNSGTTRFLFSVLSSLVSKQHPEAFDALIDLWGQKLQHLFSDGFQAMGSTWHVAIIGFTGDSPFVKKIAHFNRSFTNVRKAHTATRDLKGCCWLCKAGLETSQESYPFEHLGYFAPKWVATQGANNRPLPWTGNGGPLLQYMMLGTDAPAFFRPDFFHIFHAGVGKDFLGSSLVYAMKAIYGLGGVKRDLRALNEALGIFLRSHKLHLHMGSALTEDHLGYTSTREYPEGHWSKNMDTAILMKFQVWLLQCEEHQPKVRADEILSEILVSAVAMGQVMRQFLESGFFMSSEACEDVVMAGHRFLQSFQRLAQLAHTRGLCLYKFKPKIHYLNHVLLTVKDQWQTHDAAINPIAEATFMSEDFVGRTARLSRRVSPRVVARKTIQRYDVWVKSLLDREELRDLDLSWLD